MLPSRLLRHSATPSRPYICRTCLLSSRRSAIRRISSQPAPETQHEEKKTEETKTPCLLQTLQERGYIKEIAGSTDSLSSLLATRRITAYAGIDPTAPSLHLGHLLPFMLLFWLHIHGHHAISLIGGATAKVGDPTGRLASRKDMDQTTRENNAAAMHTQVTALWSNVREAARRHGYKDQDNWKASVLDNSTWLDKLTVIDFLAVMGRGARMGTMMGRDTVRNKMAKGDGMSYAEFTYPLLQAWDWWHLYSTQAAQIQIGGSDQYGNIIAGIDAIKFAAAASANTGKEGREIHDMDAPYGITTPLLTTSSGDKFGKSAGNAVWLNADMTSAFDLYGFLLRSPDADVEKYLSLFTFLPSRRINQVMAMQRADPGQRAAQHLLAREVVNLVHGTTTGKATEEKHRLMRKPTIASLLAESSDPTNATTDGGSSSTPLEMQTERVYLPKSMVFDQTPAQLVFNAGMAPSKAAAERQVKYKGTYVGLQNSPSITAPIDFRHLVDVDLETVMKQVEATGLLVLRAGKWKVKVLEVIDDADFKARALSPPTPPVFKGFAKKAK